MSKDNSETPQIREAFKILQSIDSKPLPIEEKKELTIELAEHLLKDSKKNLTRKEKKKQKVITKIIKNLSDKGFFVLVIDQCFRTKKAVRVADQITYLINQFNIPSFLSFPQRVGLLIFKYLSPKLTRFVIPYLVNKIRKETSHVILPGEHDKLLNHFKNRKADKIRLNINHLGEAILGEDDAKKRLQLYLDDLKETEIDYVSVKISSIYSQINHLAFDDTVDQLAKKLRKLYRHAMDHPRKLADNAEEAKFVSLDMEEYKDLHLTVSLFIKVLSETEFHNLSAGIALQAYIPESYELQKKITDWAKTRVANSGAPIKIRIVKGANLASEQVDSSIRNLKLPIYKSKNLVDANFKQMIMFAMIPENARAVHIGVATHNLFDIAFALLTMSEFCVQPYVEFEMLEGMSNHVMRSLQKITRNIVVYCPVARKNDFPHAITYLIRRLDENTGPENFLKHIFGLKQGSDEWDMQSNMFSESVNCMQNLSNNPRRQQDRKQPELPKDVSFPFDNEPETDFSLLQNIDFAKKTASKFQNFLPKLIPCVIDGNEISDNKGGIGYNPSNPTNAYYRYMLAKKEHIDKALDSACSFLDTWKKISYEKRLEIFYTISKLLREKRADLLGVMMMDTGKIITESDSEINEAIDFVDYYLRQYKQLQNTKGLDISPKGTVLIASPWNFPCAIPLGGIVAALITGNCVIFKPPPEAVLVGWTLVNILWEAGVPKKALQFLNINDKPEGSYLIKDPRINKVILTGATSTAKNFLKLRSDLDLSAETGGKNAMIITNMSDSDLAIKDLVTSAFSHSGQKCSAVSLAIIEKDLYDDMYFMKKLKDTASSLVAGSASDLKTFITPLIQGPNENLKKAINDLEKNESWLLKPKQDPANPNLISPGIKMGVEPGSFMHTCELFGPILALIRARNLAHAIEIANSTEYGLTAGLHSLDTREQIIWSNKIDAGNRYINRTTTGAVVQRQPFGGWKKSCFGPGHKTGGPNYLYNFVSFSQNNLPKEKKPINTKVNNLTSFIEMLDLTAEELGIWYGSISNYSYWWKKMKIDKDPIKLVGQDNFFKYIPMQGVVFRVTDNCNELDLMRTLAAALSCECDLEISMDKENLNFKSINLSELSSIFKIINENENDFTARIRSEKISRCRFLEKPSYAVYKAAAITGCYIIHQPVVANGEVELLHYVKEASTCINYHRYGNLGIREGELRKHIL